MSGPAQDSGHDASRGLVAHDSAQGAARGLVAHDSGRSASRGLAFAVLGAGVLVAATSSILVRYAQAAGLSSLAIAAGRMLLAVAILTPLAWWRAGAELRALRARDWAVGGIAGAFLAAHFATWISSLEYTSVASSAALVTTNPIWVGLASALLLRERPSRTTMAGIALATVGSIAILLADADWGATAAADSFPAAGPAPRSPMLGNLLALIGAITVSGYFLVGRSLRDRVSLLAYVWIAYAASALVLAVAAFSIGAPAAAGWAAVPAWGWACLAGLAIGPQLLGHTAFNWSLRRLSATFVAVSILGEPLGSALFAWLLFGESVSAAQAAGFALLLAGIAVSSRGER